ncbi:MAG: DegT/DnrJ/EryC1/StrS family aminotransferase [Deltaproteobacteria bacterium]|nr:DegT/DnrJ/EryC1/StrS family aminotransferase [Candidatus Zymogenaceae bacterium]
MGARNKQKNGSPVPFFDLQRQYHVLKGDIDAAAARVFQSGRFILGSELEAFEEEFAAYCGVSHCVGVNSGTDALLLAFRALGLSPGDEVITVSATFFATVIGPLLAGARLRFVDIDPLTRLMAPELLEQALTAETKLIVPVHLYGRMADMRAISDMAAQVGAGIVEDACQAHGAKSRGIGPGMKSDCAVYSFYPTKNLGAFGDAGAVVTNDGELAKKIKDLRNYGSTEKYHHPMPGVNSRLDELQAALLRVKLAHLDEWNARRLTIARRYLKGMQNDRVVLPDIPEDGGHVLYVFGVETDDRDGLMEHLTGRGIGSLIHYPTPLHYQEALSEYRDVHLPHTERLCERVLSLPLFPELTDDEADRVIEAVNGF